MQGTQIAGRLIRVCTVYKNRGATSDLKELIECDYFRSRSYTAIQFVFNITQFIPFLMVVPDNMPWGIMLEHKTNALYYAHV